MKAILCVGGLDPSGRAGLLADARAVEAMGARPICVATALTYQSSLRVDGFHAVSVDVLESQLRTVLRDEPIAAVKLGQLATEANASLLARLLPDVPLVVDTPLASSSGARLFDSEAIPRAYAPLMERAALVTPNGPETCVLAGRSETSNRDELERAAELLPARAVLLKGGHVAIAHGIVEDVLLVRGRRTSFSSRHLDGRFRGTGCRLASAIAARLASGDALPSAVDAARKWLHAQLRQESR